MHEYRKLSTELAGCCLNRPEPGPEIASNTVEGGLLGAGRRPHSRGIAGGAPRSAATLECQINHAVTREQAGERQPHRQPRVTTFKESNYLISSYQPILQKG